MKAILKFKSLELKRKKEIIIFFAICFFALSFLVVSITLLSLGIDDYKIFVEQHKKAQENDFIYQNISMFIYGLFFIIMGFLLLIVIVLYGNHLFNKKLKI